MNNVWLIILGMAVVTYLPRLIPLAMLEEASLPLRLKRMLQYVPITIFSAIVGSEFLPSAGWFHYRVDGHLFAGLGAIGVAWFTSQCALDGFSRVKHTPSHVRAYLFNIDT